MSGRTRRLGDLTWTELDGPPDERPILAVPIGSCEQHGPHLPLDTDTRIAVAVAAGLAAADPRVLVTPPIGITASGEHQGFPGTLSIGTAATELVLIELVRSADWAYGVVFVNGHGGNIDAVRAAAALSSADGRRVLAWWPRLRAGDAHAGRTETSLMLAIAPEVVRTDLARPGVTTPVPALLDDLRRGGVAAVSPNGVLGDPTGATAIDGADLLDQLVTDLVAQVRQWAAT